MTKDEEIKRLNEKIEFLARTNMLYSDWEHRETQVTSDLVRKGIEASRLNVELREEIERLKQRTWIDLTDEEVRQICGSVPALKEAVREAGAKLKEKNAPADRNV